MQHNVTPDSIFQVSSGFMASKHLFVAVEIGLFEHIGDAGSTLGELSARTNVPRRTLRMVADAMVALGFIERRGDLYLNGPVAATFLSGRTPADLRPMMRFWDRLSYRRWMNLEAAVRTDGASAAGYHGGFTPEDQRIFSEGVESVTAGAAQALAAIYDFAASPAGDRHWRWHGIIPDIHPDALSATGRHSVRATVGHTPCAPANCGESGRIADCYP